MRTGMASTLPRLIMFSIVNTATFAGAELRTASRAQLVDFDALNFPIYSKLALDRRAGKT